ncbi:MAG: pyruvate kinase alpha/beta domain-containing protein [Bacillota bacterium]
MTVYFEVPGRHNTEQTASIALNRAQELGIKHIVVASNTGYTAEFFTGKGVNLTCVTHQQGFREPGTNEMSQEMRENLTNQGVNVLTTTHLFGNVERAVTNKFGGLYPGGIISHTLRMFSQGTKVAVEIAVMALDAGMIPYGEPIVSVAGSGGGADTALVLIPSHSNTVFDTQILEILCKPLTRKK